MHINVCTPNSCMKEHQFSSDRAVMILFHNIPRRPAPEEFIASDTRCIRFHLCVLDHYKRQSMCRSHITFAATRTENQSQTPGLYCRNPNDLEEYPMAMHLRRLRPTDWWILFDIQAGSHPLSLLGLALNVCLSLNQNKQIVSCLVNYICMLLISVSLNMFIQWVIGGHWHSTLMHIVRCNSG